MTEAHKLDAIMEDASWALARMDYLECEARCAAALTAARQQCSWAYYARILLPLQEARRQRRMIAAEGQVRLGSTGLPRDAQAMLGHGERGCILLTHPHDAANALALHQAARQQRKWVEVLWADNAASAGKWTLRAFCGPAVACNIDAPRRDWVDQWQSVRVSGSAPVPARKPSDAPPAQPEQDPADWFLDASEALGDAALAMIDREAPFGDDRQTLRHRLELLEASLDAAGDHEILHQRLADTAQRLALVEGSGDSGESRA